MSLETPRIITEDDGTQWRVIVDVKGLNMFMEFHCLTDPNLPHREIKERVRGRTLADFSENELLYLRAKAEPNG